MPINFIDHKIKNTIDVNITNGLIHRWPLTSNANDVIGGLNMTNNGSVTFSSNGASFNGSNQWLSCTKTRPAQITMSIWVTPVNFSARRCGFCASDTGGGQTVWGFDADTNLTSMVALYANGTSILTIANEYNTTNYPTSIKTLVCLTYNGATLSYYRNTTLLGSISVTPTVTGSTYLAIGRQGAYAGCYWYGTLIDARVYSRALSSTEITTLYSNGPNLDLNQQIKNTLRRIYYFRR